MKDCTTCKYGHDDERLGIPMCHHPKRFSEDCVDFNMHEEKEIKESEKPIPADLEEAAKEYAEMHGFRVPYDGSDNFYDDANIKASKEGFIAGAKWQKEQYHFFNKAWTENMQAELDRNYENGKKAMKEQMMSKAVECIVEDWNPEPHPEITIPLNPEEFSNGDRVRFIIVKEDSHD